MTQPWTQTYTKIKFDFISPTIDMIDIQDIARGLSMQCRFAGQCNEFYSVAEHSYHASVIANSEDKLFALLHDASEAYISDLPTPLKAQLPKYEEIENNIQKIIFQRYDDFESRTFIHKLKIKEIDTRLLHHEASRLLNHPSVDNWIHCSTIENINLKYYCPKDAEQLFLKQFRKIRY